MTFHRGVNLTKCIRLNNIRVYIELPWKQGRQPFHNLLVVSVLRGVTVHLQYTSAANPKTSTHTAKRIIALINTQ